MRYFGVFLAIVSCAPTRHAGSDVKVTNGLLADKSVELIVPEVQDRFGKAYCSSVLIGPNALLTAAHCLMAMQKEIVQTNEGIYALGTRSLLVVSPPVSTLDLVSDSQFTALDLAVVVLKNDRLAGYKSIDTGATRVAGTKVLLAGYGGSDANKPAQTSGKLRIGENELIASENSQTLALKGLISNVTKGATGTDTATAHGDSGGPVFSANGAKVLGITSSGRIENGEKLSFFSNLASQPSRYLLCRAAKAGAKIPSLTTSDCDEFGAVKSCIYVIPADGKGSISIKC